MSLGIVTDVTSSLFRYKFLLLEPYFIKLFKPEILHHAAISVIYMSMSLSLSQPEKASEPILVTLSGIVTFVKPVQPRKA